MLICGLNSEDITLFVSAIIGRPMHGMHFNANKTFTNTNGINVNDKPAVFDNLHCLNMELNTYLYSDYVDRIIECIPDNDIVIYLVNSAAADGEFAGYYKIKNHVGVLKNKGTYVKMLTVMCDHDDNYAEQETHPYEDLMRVSAAKMLISSLIENRVIVHCTREVHPHLRNCLKIANVHVTDSLVAQLKAQAEVNFTGLGYNHDLSAVGKDPVNNTSGDWCGLICLLRGYDARKEKTTHLIEHIKREMKSQLCNNVDCASVINDIIEQWDRIDAIEPHNKRPMLVDVVEVFLDMAPVADLTAIVKLFDVFDADTQSATIGLIIERNDVSLNRLMFYLYPGLFPKNAAIKILADEHVWRSETRLMQKTQSGWVQHGDISTRLWFIAGIIKRDLRFTKVFKIALQPYEVLKSMSQTYDYKAIIGEISPALAESFMIRLTDPIMFTYAEPGHSFMPDKALGNLLFKELCELHDFRL